MIELNGFQNLVYSGVVTAFEKIAGRNAKIAEESNTFYKNIGQFVGKIHKFSHRDEQARRFYYSNLLYNMPYIDMDFFKIVRMLT